MDIEGVVIKAEDAHMPQSCECLVTVKEENPDLEAGEVKLESELILSDYEDEKHSQEIILENSSPNLTRRSNAVVAPERTLKIILKRCDDAGETRHFNLERSTAFEGMNESSSVAPALRIKVETESEATRSFASESGIACSDNTVKAAVRNDIIMEQSSTNSAGNCLTTMVSRRLPIIICERCDAKKGSKLQPELSIVPQIENENCSNAVPVSIKVETAFESTETVESETYSIDANDSDQTAVGNAEQSDCHLQGNAFVKIEKEESPVIKELVGHLPRSLVSENHDKKPLLKIVKLEESKLHAAICFKIEKEEEDDTAKTAVGNLVDTCLERNASVDDDVVNSSASGSLSNCFQSHTCIKSEEEKCHITKELVSSLPGSSTSREHGKKCESKTLEFAETLTGVEDELQSGAYSASAPTNACDGKTPSTVFELKSKVLSGICLGKNVGKKLYSCTECPYRCDRQSDLIRHMRVHNGERPFECRDCAKKFKTKANLKRHMSTHSKEKLFECKDCSARFKWKSNLVRHLRRHSDERGYSCSVCSSKFKTKENLKQHFATHINERRFECAHCNHRFKSKCYLRLHLRIHVDKKLYSCSYCPSTFRLPRYLKSHLVAKHSSSERFYTCAHCATKFKRRDRLVQHMATHSNEKLHSCPQCPMTFTRRSSLRIHLRSHTGEKPYSCDQCLDSFRSNAQLNRHKKTHEAGRLYCCAHCPHIFKTKDVLRMHLKVAHFHIEKRHACSQCSYRTYRSSNLKQHLLVHTGEKPYACAHCPSRFCLKNNLSEHSKRHLQGKLSSG